MINKMNPQWMSFKHLLGVSYSNFRRVYSIAFYRVIISLTITQCTAYEASVQNQQLFR